MTAKQFVRMVNLAILGMRWARAKARVDAAPVKPPRYPHGFNRSQEVARRVRQIEAGTISPY